MNLYTARSQAGFSLMELIVAITIMAILAAVVVPNVIRHLDEANVNGTYQSMHGYKTALVSFKADTGRLPSTQEGLKALVDGGSIKRWKGPYVDTVSPDAWGNDFIYKSPGDNKKPYDIISYGADGTPGGEGYNKDLSIWDDPRAAK